MHLILIFSILLRVAGVFYSIVLWRRLRDWRIGTEHEKFGFTTDDLRPLPYDGPRGINAVLSGLASQFGWRPQFEGEHLIALLDDTGASITLEPGGQATVPSVSELA